MKSIVLITGFLLIAFLNSFSQNLVFEKNEEAKSQKNICGFLSFDSKLTSLNGNNAEFYGGAFGIVIKQRTRIGLGGYSLRGKNMFEYLNPLGDNKEYHFNSDIEYFGSFFEYVILPDTFIHITIPVVLAGGTATIN